MVQVKNSAKRRAVAAAIAAAVMLASTNARADGFDVSGIISWLSKIWDQLGNGSAAVVGAIETSFKGQTQAMGQIADAQHVANTALAKTVEQSKAVSEYELPPDPCLTAGAAEAARLAAVGRARAESMQNAQLTDRMLNATTAAKGGTARYDAYEIFKSKYDPRRGSDLPNADVLVDSLLSGAGKPGREPNYTFDDRQMGAAQQYIMNAVNITPLPTLTEKQENSDDGHRYISLQRSEQAKYSMAQAAFTEALSWRTPIDGLKEKVGDMWRAMAQVIAPQGALPSGKMSAQTFIYNEVDRRYSNPNWYVAVASSSQAAAIKEGLYMQALELELRLLELQKLERLNLLLGQGQMTALAASPARQEAQMLYEKIRAAR